MERRFGVRAGWCGGLLLVLVGCEVGAPEQARPTDAGLGERATHVLLGQLLELEACEPAAADSDCEPKVRPGVEICTVSGGERNCATTDADGRFTFDELTSERLRFELEAAAGSAHYLVAASLAPTDALPGESGAGLRLTADALTLTLAEDGALGDAIASTLRIDSRPFARGEASEAAQFAAVALAVSAQRGEADDEVTVQLPRLPLPGESWTVRADRTAGCDECEAGELELAWLTSVRARQAPSQAMRAAMQSLLPRSASLPLFAPVVSAAGISAIDQKHSALGGRWGLLGAPTSSHLSSARGGVRRNYERGAILWSSATGAFEVHGAILETYDLWGGEAGPFGYPLSDEIPVGDGVGRRNFFEAAAIYWKPDTGAHSVFGALQGRWGQLGDARGTLGYPVTDSLLTPDGIGAFNYFERGALYWHPTYGARMVRGKILERWGTLGWETGPLGYPTSDERMVSGRPRSDFEHGSIDFRNVGPELKVLSQNMGIMVAPAGYKGEDTDFALNGLVHLLQGLEPDVVALQEVFDNSWYSRLINDSRIRYEYPYRMHGPFDSNPANTLDSDGGLVILSRYPIVRSDQTVFRTCAGEDCLAAKGVLYARVDVGQGVYYDVFNTHLNNDEPEFEGSIDIPTYLAVAAGWPGLALLDGAGLPAYTIETTNAQLNAVKSFVDAKRGTQRYPAVLMGDLNVRGEDSQAYVNLLARLGFPKDAWAATHRTAEGVLSDPGITFDEVNSFERDKPLPVVGPRGVSGHRLDYVFLFDGQAMQPRANHMEVVRGQNVRRDPGLVRDLSDHYGLLAQLGATQQMNVRLNRPLQSVRVSFGNFYVHDLSGITADADDVTFDLSVSADGRPSDFSTTADPLRVPAPDRVYTYARSPMLTLSQVNSQLTVATEGWEHDTFGRASLGRRSLVFAKDDLIDALIQTRAYRLDVHDRKDAQYTSEVRIRAH